MPVPLKSGFDPAVLTEVKPLPGSPVPWRIVLCVPTIHPSLWLTRKTLSRATLCMGEGETRPDQIPVLK